MKELAYSFYEDLTKEELSMLPKVDPALIEDLINKYGFNPLMWDGETWGIALEAFI